MMKLIVAAMLALAAPAAAAPAAPAAPLRVTLDAESARGVLKALANPALTREEALALARLPGNAGLIRKVLSYDRPADEAKLADALLAAAKGGSGGDVDANYRFVGVRDNAAAIGETLDYLADPAILADVRTRILAFTPARVRGEVGGYLIAGGTSGGFAFDEPKFYLNVAMFPSAPLARTILAHELYHGVQQLAAASRKPAAGAAACRAKLPGGANLARLFDSLLQEGAASYVGDVLALPAGDAPVEEARKRSQRGVNMIGRSVTLLRLSTHALATDPEADYDAIYGLGFYGDEILYPLGYVMARAIVAEGGDAALAELIDRPGAEFVTRYAALKAYGGKDAPALDKATLERARALAACG
ncbi:hypothetical protein E2493_04510 [Sphingomonas parva]|uniref:DUF2268 domain-containing protein n=1 Tax=Sphingomonas parva TaxID=2555898 RepID=A0A4Y8ZXC3_9SPHN|nr:DUF5700 domain-containing putative Zn-dependent protease [Sphingomonas parva]TFI59459.1 hypothetical protein E2493_04510 [Sphingomonas parva]